MILYKNKRLVIPAGLSPNINHQSVEIKNENKYVSITENGTEIVTFDPENYTGLGIVQINTEVPAAAIQQPTSVSISDNGNYSVFPDEGYVGISEVSVNVNVQPKLQLKIVDSSTSAQVIIPDDSYVGMAQVSINPYVLDNKTVDPSTNNITVTSSKDGLSSVTVTPITSSIDSNISAGNIKNGVTILGVQGTYSGTTINNQNKTIDSSTSVQSVTYDSGYTGLGTVTVNPYTLQNKALQLEPSYRNEDVGGAVVKVEPDEGYDGLSYFQYRLPSILTSKTFDASTGNQTYVTNTANTYVKGINKIVINGLDLDSCYTLAASI